MNPKIDPNNPHNLDIYTQLLNYMNEAIWIGDQEEKTLYANPKFCTLLGYTLDEILGKESYEFWDDESQETVKHVNQSERQKGKASSYEGKLLTKSKKRIPVLVSGAPLPDGGTIGIITDLSEVKKKEKSEKILSQALEHAGDAIILLSTKGEILSWNHGAKKIFGYKKEEVEGKNITFFFPNLEERSFHASGGDEFIGLELIASHKTDGERIVAVSVMPIYYARDKVEECNLCIVRDITLEKRSEIELSSRYQKIKDAYEWLGRVQRQSDYLTDLIMMTTNGYDPHKIFPTIIHGMIFLSGADACEIRIHDEQRGTLDLASHFGFTGNLRNYKSVPYHESWGEKSYTSESPYYLIDLIHDKKYPLVKHFIQEKYSSSLTVALRGKGKCVGSVTLLSKDARVLDLYANNFLEKYLRLVEIIVNAL